jgi:hypothetical protein
VHGSQHRKAARTAYLAETGGQRALEWSPGRACESVEERVFDPRVGDFSESDGGVTLCLRIGVLERAEQKLDESRRVPGLGRSADHGTQAPTKRGRRCFEVVERHVRAGLPQSGDLAQALGRLRGVRARQRGDEPRLIESAWRGRFRAPSRGSSGRVGQNRPVLTPTHPLEVLPRGSRRRAQSQKLGRAPSDRPSLRR